MTSRQYHDDVARRSDLIDLALDLKQDRELSYAVWQGEYETDGQGRAARK